MNVLKNYNNKLNINSLVELFTNTLFFILIPFSGHVIAAPEIATSPANSIEAFDYLKVFLGLAFVIGLFLISTFLFKRFGNGPMLGRGQLRVVDGLHLGNRERLMLVAVGNKKLLLAVTPGTIRKLESIENEFASDQENESRLEVVEQENTIKTGVGHV